MAEVAQGVARTLETVFGVGQQMVDLRHQRFQLPWHLFVELRTLPALQLGNLLPRPVQRTQGAAHGDALQQQNQQQPRQPETQADLLHPAEAVTHRRVVLGHADGNRLAQPSIVGAQHQQLLAFRAQLQVAVQARVVEPGQFLVPQGAGAPVHVGKIDAEIVPGKRPLVGRRQTSFIQLQPLRAAHQGHQQVLAVVAQPGFQVTLQAQLEQPKAGLCQDQADHHHHTDQPQAQAPLDGSHCAFPPNR